MSHLLRIVLPDVPGSLGAVASAIGLTGANIVAIEIVEQRSDGTAVDDVFVEFDNGVMPDMVVSAVQRLDGIRVLWVSRYAAAGNLHLDLEAVELLTEDPERAAARLTELAPGVFRSDWAMVATATDGLLVSVHASPGSPVLPPAAVAWFPVEKATRPEIPADWDGFSATTVAIAPLGSGDRMIAFGRHGGPEILDSELARLGLLAALTGSIESPDPV